MRSFGTNNRLRVGAALAAGALLAAASPKAGAQAPAGSEATDTARSAAAVAVIPRPVRLTPSPGHSVLTRRERKDAADFRARLATHLRRLDALDVNYRPLDAPRGRTASEP